MNRRGFFGALTGLVAGAALDPERLLWVPGKKLISIPRPQWHQLSVRFDIDPLQMLSFDRFSERYLQLAAAAIRKRAEDYHVSLCEALPLPGRARIPEGARYCAGSVVRAGYFGDDLRDRYVVYFNPMRAVRVYEGRVDRAFWGIDK